MAALVPPLPGSPQVRRAVDEIAAAVLEDAASSYGRFVKDCGSPAISGFAFCTVDDAVPPYAMGAVPHDFAIPDLTAAPGGARLGDLSPPDWSWNDPGGSFACGDVIARVQDSEEVAPDDLDGWRMRSWVCLRGMVEGLKRFDAGGHFKSSLPRDRMLLLLWVHDTEHRDWVRAWARELNPPPVARWFAGPA